MQCSHQISGNIIETSQNLQEHVCESQFGHPSKGFRQKTFYSSYEDWIEGIGRAGKAGMGGVK